MSTEPRSTHHSYKCKYQYLSLAYGNNYHTNKWEDRTKETQATRRTCLKIVTSSNSRTSGMREPWS
jgi:hypothetical protein